jgi:hypothetical protein
LIIKTLIDNNLKLNLNLKFNVDFYQCSKTCKGDSNYRIQLDMVAALKTAGAGAQGWAPGGEGGTRKSSQQGWGDRGLEQEKTSKHGIIDIKMIIRR